MSPCGHPTTSPDGVCASCAVERRVAAAMDAPPSDPVELPPARVKLKPKACPVCYIVATTPGQRKCRECGATLQHQAAIDYLKKVDGRSLKAKQAKIVIKEKARLLPKQKRGWKKKVKTFVDSLPLMKPIPEYNFPIHVEAKFDEGVKKFDIRPEEIIRPTPLTITIDFDDYPELLKKLTEIAKEECRTVGGQFLWMLKNLLAKIEKGGE